MASVFRLELGGSRPMQRTLRRCVGVRRGAALAATADWLLREADASLGTAVWGGQELFGRRKQGETWPKRVEDATEAVPADAA